MAELTHFRADSIPEDWRFQAIWNLGSVEVELFVLEIERGTARERRLLYGWIVPKAGLLRKKWTGGKGPMQTMAGELGSLGFRYRFRKFAKSFSMRGLIDDLASKDPKKIEDTFSSEESSALFLGGLGEDAQFGVLPPTYLKTRGEIRSEDKGARGMASPLSDAAAWSVILPCIEKRVLFSAMVDGERFAGPDELLDEAIDWLGKETGFAFSSSDSARIGSLEFISPMTDLDGIPLVNVKVERDKEGKREVKVRIETPKGEVALLTAECQFELSGTTISSQVKTLVVEDSHRIEMTFSGPENFGSLGCRVWATDKTAQTNLMHSEHVYFVREVNVQMGIVHGGGKIASNWLSALERGKSASIAARAAALQKVERISHQPIRAGLPKALFELNADTGREISSNADYLPSGAKFFSSGWEGSGKLSFYEWFKEIGKEHHSGTILLLDPYFDKRGLELFARMSSGAAFKVLTNSQVKSDSTVDDQETSKGNSPLLPDRTNRFNELKAAAEASFQAFAGLDFEILDLRSAEGGSRQLFHDRYLLLFDLDQIPIKGFQVSNSINSASVRYPLLITPIPKDVLGLVSEYVGKLASGVGPGDNQHKVESIYSTKRSRIDLGFPDDWPAIEDVIFFERVWSRRRLEEPTEKLATVGFLKNVGLVDEKGRQYLLSDSKQGVGNTVDWLATASDGEIFTFLGTFGRLLAKTTEAYKVVEAFEATDGAKGAVEPLCRFIGMSFQSEFPQGVIGVGEKLAYRGWVPEGIESFSELIKKAAGIARYGGERHYSVPLWGLRYACDLVFSLGPREGLDVLANLLVRKTGADREVFFNLTTERILEQTFFQKGREILEALLQSSWGFYQALGVGIVAERMTESTRFTRNDLSLFERLEIEKQVTALAFLAGEMRVRINRGTDGTFTPESVRKDCFDAIRSNWQVGWRQPELRRIVRLVSGPIEGSGAGDIDNGFLLLLQKDHSYMVEERAKLWIDVFWTRLTGASIFGESKDDAYDIYYYSAVDSDVSRVAVSVLQSCSLDVFESWISGARKLIKQDRSVLEKPFSISINYSEWRKAFQRLFWLQGVADAIQKKRAFSQGQVLFDENLRKAVQASKDRVSRSNDDPTEEMRF